MTGSHTRQSGVRRRVTRLGALLGAAGLVLALGPLLPQSAAAATASTSSAATVGQVTPASEEHQGMSAGSQDAVVHGAAPVRRASVASSTLYGVDVSRWQHPNGKLIDWSTFAQTGKNFAVIKATELTSVGLYTNPYLGQDLDGARAAGLVTGTYAFARPENGDATTQAKAFANAIGPIPPHSLPPTLDLEKTGGLTPDQLISWTHTFLEQLQAATGVVPMIYVSPGFWRSAMANTTDFSSYPLWQATWLDSRTCSVPPTFGGWTSYTIWQYTDSASVPGIPATVDGDCFQGTPAQLATTARRASPPGLSTGDVLNAGDDVESPSGQYRAVMQSDGNFVVYGNGRALWAVGPRTPGSSLAVQDDGNVVMYDPSGAAVWAIGSAGLAPVLSMQDDGNLVLRLNGNPVWTIGAPGTNAVSPSTSLRFGWYIHSTDGSARAIMQADGNFVVYVKGQGVWATGTGARGLNTGVQADGNIVVYGNAAALWSSRSAPAGANGRLVIQNDGNLVLYGAHGAVWATHT